MALKKPHPRQLNNKQQWCHYLKLTALSLKILHVIFLYTQTVIVFDKSHFNPSRLIKVALLKCGTDLLET